MSLLKEQKPIGAITILSAITAVACMLLGLVAVNFNNDAMSYPMLVLSTAGTNAVAARWSMIADMFGYYILLLPVIYLFQDWMQNKTAWHRLVTFCGLAYVLIGSIGAAILAVVWPNIMDAYQLATETQQQILKANFSLINDTVYGGLWNLLEMNFAAAWWIIVGYQLVKNGFKYMGWLTIATGISCAGDAAAGMLQSAKLHELFLNIYLLLTIVWAIAIGIFLIQGKLK